jgi:hypothetical protein
MQACHQSLLTKAGQQELAQRAQLVGGQCNFQTRAILWQEGQMRAEAAIAIAQTSSTSAECSEHHGH